MSEKPAAIERPAPALPFGFGPALLGCFLLGLAIVYSDGAYSEAALFAVVLATLVLGWTCATALDQGAFGTSGPDARFLLGLVWVGAFGALWFTWDLPRIIIYAYRTWGEGHDALMAFFALLFSYVPFLSGRLPEPAILRHLRFAALAAAVLWAGLGVIKSSPHPYIDVWTVQQAGAEALAHGKNPFEAVAVRDTGPRVANDVPYVYPPTQVYLTLPAYLLGGDVRYAMLAALVLTGAALRFIVRRSGRALPALAEDAPALFFWFMPKLFFILEQSWVDPMQIMLLSVSVAVWVAGWRTPAAVLFGITFSAKQTMFWLVPMAGIGLRFTRKEWLIALGVAAAAVLPFVLLDFKALLFANFQFVDRLPPRPDALTLINWYARKFGEPLSPKLGFLLAGVVALAALWKTRGSVARFTIAAAFTYVLFFVFNKWAFANYYFTLAGLAALAAAGAFHGEPVPQAQAR